MFVVVCVCMYMCVKMLWCDGGCGGVSFLENFQFSWARRKKNRKKGAAELLKIKKKNQKEPS